MRSQLMYVCLFIAAIALPSTAIADLYKYRTSDGTYCFTDDAGTIPRKYRGTVTMDDSPLPVSILESPDMAPGKIKSKRNYQATANGSYKTKFDGTVELHVLDHCPHGDEAEAYLKKIGARYSRQDHSGKDPMFKISGNLYGSVIVIVGNKTLRGFSAGAIDQAMEQGGR